MGRGREGGREGREGEGRGRGREGGEEEEEKGEGKGEGVIGNALVKVTTVWAEHCTKLICTNQGQDQLS